MILAQLLNRAVLPEEKVLAEFVQTMAEPFIATHTLTPAKGSTHHYFGKNQDQSMVAHIFNGIFPTMRLLAQADLQRSRPYLSETGQRLYILGYAMHDLNKIKGMMDEVGTANRQQVQAALAMLAEELARVNAAAFFPGYADYLEDILFLVINTQLVSGVNLSTYQFPGLVHDERERSRARDLCTYSDCLSFLVKSPADVLHGDAAKTLTRVVDAVSDKQFSLVYHQFSDVRGLLTNLVNNGVKEQLTRPDATDEPTDLLPYLYFPNGTVYLKTDRQVQSDSSPNAVWVAVENKLKTVCVNDDPHLSRINENTPGFGFDNKSILKFPSYFYDLLRPEQFVAAMIPVCLRTKANVTESTLASMQKLQTNPPREKDRLPSSVSFANYNPADERIASVGRFLRNFDRLIVEKVEQTDKEAGAALRLLMQTTFGFSKEELATALLIPSRGGLDFRYFWLAAQFLSRTPGLATEGEDEGSLTHFLRRFVNEASPLFSTQLVASWQGVLLPQLRRYLSDHLSFGGFNQPAIPAPDFAAELQAYTAAKRGRAASLPCTVCNSSYLVKDSEGQAQAQNEAATIFQPYVYKNRLPLNAAENAGGICAICLLEMMLRQLLQRDKKRKIGKDFEEVQRKFIYLYPSYFFTTETAALVGTIVGKMTNFSVHEANKRLAKTKLTPLDYLDLPMFDTSDYDEEDNPRRGYYNMEYAEGEVQGLTFFGLQALGNEPTASERWTTPAILGLMLPLVLGCKVVVSDNYLPLFASGEDFKETVVLDAAHPFLSYLLPADREWLTNEQAAKARKPPEPGMSPSGRIRIDRVMDKLRLVSRAYFINYDTYGEPRDPKWQMINRTARALRSDPLNVFAYLVRQARKEDAKSLAFGYWPERCARYMQAYADIWNGLCEVLGGKYKVRVVNDDSSTTLKLVDAPSGAKGEHPMEVVSGLVDRYAIFYSPDLGASASIVRPLESTAKLLLARPYDKGVQSEAEYAADIKLMIQGELMRWLDRIRNSEGSGRAMFYGRAISEQEAPALANFADFFYDKVFKGYCRGELGLLRSRLNNLKSGCEAYYSLNWRRWRKKSAPGEATPGDTIMDQTEAASA